MEFEEDAMRRPILTAVSITIAAISVLMLIALGIILPSLFHALTGWLPRMIVLLALCTATAGAFLGALVISIIALMLLVFDVKRKLPERARPRELTPKDGPFGGRWAKYAPGASSDEVDVDEEEDDIAPPAFIPKSRRPRDATATLLFAALIVLLAGIGLVVASAATLIVFSVPLL